MQNCPVEFPWVKFMLYSKFFLQNWVKILQNTSAITLQFALGAAGSEHKYAQNKRSWSIYISRGRDNSHELQNY